MYEIRSSRGTSSNKIERELSMCISDKVGFVHVYDEIFI